MKLTKIFTHGQIGQHLAKTSNDNASFCMLGFNPSRLVQLCLIGGLLSLSACATKPKTEVATSTKEVTTTQVAQEKTLKTLPTPQVDAPNIPEIPLTANFIYKYLVAEIAGQRGDFATAGTIFYQLAAKENDARFAERAAKTAAYGRIKSLIYPSVKLWATLDPTSVEAQQAITEILIKNNQLNNAEPHLAKLLEKDETRPRAFLFLNNILTKSDDKQGVLRLVKSLAAPYQDLPEAQFATAQAAIAAGESDTAIEALTKADFLNPGWNLAALLKGQILFIKSPQEAINFYEKFLSEYPNHNEIRINYAKMLVSEDQYERAKQEFPTIIQHAKNSVDNASSDAILESNKKIAIQQSEKNLADITAVIGLLSYQADDYAAANSYFQQALDLNFKDPDQIYLYFGQVAEKQNKLEMAKEWYEKIPNGKHFLTAQLSIAHIIKSLQSVDNAITFLSDIDYLNKEQQIVVIQTQGSILREAGRNQDAFKLLADATKNIPDSPSLNYDFALTAESIKQYDLMEKLLRKAIKDKPNFAAAYNALGYSFADRNIKLNDAVKLIKKALELSPNDHYMLDSLGWAYYKKGYFSKAVEYLRQAYNVQPDPEIAAHLGEVLWQKGDHNEAKKIWNDALTKHPNNEVLISTTMKFKS